MRGKLESFFERNELIPKKENSRSWIFDCPCCNGKEKLSIEKDSGRSVCFKQKTPECPKPGSKPIYILSKLTEIPFQEVARQISNENIVVHDNWTQNMAKLLQGKEEIRNPNAIDPVGAKSLPDDILLISDPKAYDGLLYLINRGLTIDVKKYSVMYSPSARRVIFPVIMNNKLYGWQGRAIDKDNQLRMYNLKGEWQSKTLMFYDNIKGKDYAILTEGAIDALKFEKAGNFVAAMGKNSITNAKLELIRDAGIRKLYLGLDRDALDLVQDIKKRVDSLRSGIKCFIIEVPEHRDDFGDCTYDECLSAFNSARPINDFELFLNFDKNMFFKGI